ncbi:unnamed protein product [Lactuca saligna]|uniref:Transposase, Ptta/En/Spm, plant n=1 Tax=Lactuca saligna TaxID=75948 RepID=A0AA35UZN1_LACSI|nr:unnamed protein product [Lactuca saligna]
MPAVSQLQAFLPTVAASNDNHSHFTPALSPLPQPITSRPPLVSVVGKKFGRYDVVRAVRRLIDQYIEGSWISFKEIPKEVIEHIWIKFKTLYDWDFREDEKVRENFEFIVQDRYRDLMGTFRNRSADMARAAGHDISPDNKDYNIMQNFVPNGMQSQRWKDLCREWNTDAWLKRSASAKSNRNTADSGGKIARHTGGSISYDEHRIRFIAKKGRPPTFLELFLITHLDKTSKKKYFDGDVEGKQFCTERAREAYEAYSRALLEKYGDDLVDHPIDDAELWAKTQREISGASRSSYIYGVGSSDINSLFNGKSSVGAGCSSSYCGSQQEVKELRNQLENVERERVLMQQKQEMMEQQLAQLMRRFGNPPEDRC